MSNLIPDYQPPQPKPKRKNSDWEGTKAMTVIGGGMMVIACPMLLLMLGIAIDDGGNGDEGGVCCLISSVFLFLGGLALFSSGKPLRQ